MRRRNTALALDQMALFDSRDSLVRALTEAALHARMIGEPEIVERVDAALRAVTGRNGQMQQPVWRM